jgi:2,4-dichlorophenol 6-monooxygenase
VAALAELSYRGLGVVTQTATLHVSADLSPWARDPEVLIRWIFSPQAGTLVVLVPMGPQKWGPHSEEWVIHLNYSAGDPAPSPTLRSKPTPAGRSACQTSR